jgi:glycosyltransferase involved in cell wall biosynthesis
VKLSVAYTHLSHHAGRSGYDQVVRYLASRTPVERLEARMPRHVPWRAWQWADRRMASEWYDIWSLTIEASAARRLVTGPETVHLLYGEDTYRHLGSLPPRARHSGARLICTYHQPPAKLRGLLPPDRRLDRLDGVVALTGEQASFLAELVGEDRVFSVPHGVDTSFFSSRSDGLSWRQNDDPVCLFAGSWLRDMDQLATAVRLVGERDPWIRFRLIGGGERLAAMTARPNVEVVGHVSDDELVDEYRGADLFLLPLTDCTANNCLLEAMACGLPLVATDVGGVRDYTGDDAAALVPAGDGEAMAEAILSLCRDPARRAAMSRAARSRAQELDWDRVAGQLLDVYEEVGA